MGRRRRNRTRLPQERSAIGDSHVEDAVVQLSLCQKTAVATMCQYDIGREETIRMIFPDRILENSKAAKGVVDPSSDIVAYEISESANLYINFDEKCPYAAIMHTVLLLQPNAAPLLNFVRAVQAVHEQYEEVKYLLRWFNRHGTPAGIRYYWPTVLQLCGKAPALAELGHVPSRYVTPQGLSDRLQLVKDTATTVAASLMLPKITTPPRGVMWLSFDKYTINRGPVDFTGDAMTYHF